MTNDKKSLPYNSSKGCPAGYHKRESYLSVLGRRIEARCVRSTTVYKNSSKNFKKKVEGEATQRLRAMHIPSVRSLTRKQCPPGQVERKQYVRKYSTAVREKGFTVRRASGATYRVYPKARPTHVESKCVPDKGKSRKNSKTRIGPLRKGELAKHGYSFKKTETERHTALKSAVNEFKPLGVYRKLDAVAKLVENTVPDAAVVFRKDRNWIKDKYGPLEAF